MALTWVEPLLIKVLEAPNTWVYGMFDISVPKALAVKVEVELAFEVWGFETIAPPMDFWYWWEGCST